MNARSGRLWRWAPVVAAMAAIFYVSGQSQPQVPGGLSDTTGHVLAYTGLTLLIVRAVAGGLPARIGLRTAGISLAIAVAYGISDEVHQAFVPGRTPDVNDVLADALGGAIAIGACWAWGIIRGPARPSRLPTAKLR